MRLWSLLGNNRLILAKRLSVKKSFLAVTSWVLRYLILRMKLSGHKILNLRRAGILLAGSLTPAILLLSLNARSGVTKPDYSSPVVVELFTSEGCSSCPPADALLSKLSQQSSTLGAEVIALEEHVDYWDDLGWRDPFSSRDWTDRQYAYAKPLGNGNAYTPQMVVDGTTEFVGSRPELALKSISQAAQRPKTSVTLSHAASVKPGIESFSVTVGKLHDPSTNGNAEIWLAITESGLHSAVKGGENVGQDLYHAAIVRFMRKIGEAKGGGDPSFTGTATISIHKDWKRDNLRAVVFIQDKKTLHIVGAAQTAFGS